MDQWQIDALAVLLETEIKQVEEGSRVYVSSKTYGDSRYHLINKRYDGIQIKQTNIDEKWGSRISLQSDEIPQALKTLLIWYLEGVKQEQERNQSSGDELGDLGDHPF